MLLESLNLGLIHEFGCEARFLSSIYIAGFSFFRFSNLFYREPYLRAHRKYTPMFEGFPVNI